MKVAELAKQLNTDSDHILTTLKSLKLKAKDSKQDLSPAVVSVVKSEIKKGGKGAKTAEKKAPDAKTKKKTTKKKTVKKKTAKKKTAKKKTAKKTADKSKKETEKKEDLKKPSKSTKDEKAPQKRQRPKIKISKEPVITLKPLGRKRKRGQQKDEEKTAKDRQTAKPSDEAKDAAAAAQAETPVEEEAHDESLPTLEINVPIPAKDLAVKMQQKPSVILKELMSMGMMANINQPLGKDVVKRITRKFGFNLANIKTQEESVIEEHKQQEEDASLMTPRAPVITFMGHVDHGKTTLLDKVRKSKVADKEHGGITQHIGAYSVEIPRGRITFLDTPGHEAFTSMRARGAHITDIVVLVVAADEGIMPQTKEAIDHAKAAEVPLVVALNKIDKRNADPDRVKKQLQDEGLMPEDWGGKTICVGVSGITGEGIDQLLEMILLEAEILELKANPNKRASGIVVEAHLSQGKGVVATLIVQSGTLNEGDFIVVGPYYGKVKAMFDDHERPIKEAGPSMPVEILGLGDVPEAGEIYYVVEDEKQARDISFRRSEEMKDKRLSAHSKVTLEDLYSQIQKGDIKELSVIIKSDVQGSLEALRDSLAKIPSDKVKLKFIHMGLGDVNTSDVLLAVASKAIIIAFHVGIDTQAKKELEKEPVDVRQYRIIYDAVNDVKNALEGLLEAKKKKNFLARIEIREVFKLSKHGIIAGCYVEKGKVNRKAHVDVIRDDEIIYSGKIESLKRFKDDVREVTEGQECGISIAGFDKIQKGDILEAYDIETVQQTL